MDEAEPEVSSDPGEVVIPCGDETAAREEAARQQLAEEHGADGTYRGSTGNGLQKRYVETETEPEKRTWKQRFGSMGFEVFNSGRHDRAGEMTC